MQWLYLTLVTVVLQVHAKEIYWASPIISDTSEQKESHLLVDSLASKDCGQCHFKQYEQWQSSLHAKAVSPGLLGQLSLFDDETQISCFVCHAPRKKQQINLLEGNFMASNGIDCASCHVRKNQRYGPKSIQITPHGSVIKKQLFKESKFCENCHQFAKKDAIFVNGKPLENTFYEWSNSRYSDEGITCQNCHMPSKAHTFKGIHDAKMVRSGLGITAKKNNSKLVIALINKGAGHALPTYITPRIRVIWKPKSGVDKIIAVLQRKMSWDEDSGWQEVFDTRLLPDETRLISMALEKNYEGSIEVWVDPDADYYERVYPAILDAMKETDAPDLAIKQIHNASKLASKSSYLLYALNCQLAKKNACQ